MNDFDFRVAAIARATPGEMAAPWSDGPMHVGVLHQVERWVSPQGLVVETSEMSKAERRLAVEWVTDHASHFYLAELARSGIIDLGQSPADLPLALLMSASGWVRRTRLMSTFTSQS